MSLDTLALEIEAAADLLAGATGLLQVIAQCNGKIDDKMAARIAGNFRRCDKPLRDLADEIRNLSLALALEVSEHEH